MPAERLIDQHLPVDGERHGAAHLRVGKRVVGIGLHVEGEGREEQARVLQDLSGPASAERREPLPRSCFHQIGLTLDDAGGPQAALRIGAEDGTGTQDSASASP